MLLTPNPPSNVIRIEAQDGSEEFIEIILPPTLEIDDPPLIDASEIFIPTLRGVGSVIKGIKGAKNLGKSLTRYATRQEVLNVLKDKYKLQKDKNVYMAKDNKQIKEIWEDITEGAEVLDDKPDNKKEYMIKMRKLSDGTVLKLRKKSDSGGSTIEIETEGIKSNKKIHNKAGEDGDW